MTSSRTFATWAGALAVRRRHPAGVGVPAIVRVGFSPDEVASLQALDQVRQPGQGVILDEAEPGVALQLALQWPSAA